MARPNRPRRAWRRFWLGVFAIVAAIYRQGNGELPFGSSERGFCSGLGFICLLQAGPRGEGGCKMSIAYAACGGTAILTIAAKPGRTGPDPSGLMSSPCQVVLG